MALTPSTAGVIVATGTWQLVALGGDVVLNADARTYWNMTLSGTAPSEAIEGIPFKWDSEAGSHTHEIALKATEYYWIKADDGTQITGIATEPA